MKFTKSDTEKAMPSPQKAKYSTYKPLPRLEENFDDEELLDITLQGALAKIERYQGYIDKLNLSKKKINSDPSITEISKKLRCKPYNDKIKGHRKEMKPYERVRAKHLGILEKIPKYSPLYPVAANCQFSKRCKEATYKIIEGERQLIDNFLQES